MIQDRGRSGSTFFDLPMPQYASVPETIVSDLAWSATNESSSPETVLGKPAKGIVYQRLNSPSDATVQSSDGKVVVETIPKQNDGRWMAIRETLKKATDVSSDTEEQVVQIFLDNLVGHVPAKAKSKAIIPFNAHTALMQDTRGITGAPRPPNFASIVNRMFLLGGAEQDAASLLASAYSRIDNRHQDDWISNATAELVPPELRDRVSSLLIPNLASGDALRQPAWLRNESTPFHWFSRGWRSVLSAELIEVMPRRRWMDWVTCVLRTGIGAGYMFELNFNYQMVLSLTNDEPAARVLDKALSRYRRFFYWDTSASVSARDCASRLKKLCERGTACRAFIRDQATNSDTFPRPGDYHSDPNGLERWIEAARVWLAGRDDLIEPINLAVSAPASGPAKNSYETILYSLLDRSAEGRVGDAYAMLKKRGPRFTVLEPGREWLVVMASLLSDRNDMQPVRLAELTSVLEQIGVSCDFKTLIRELERVGLALSSSDADEAIEVAKAF